MRLYPRELDAGEFERRERDGRTVDSGATVEGIEALFELVRETRNGLRFIEVWRRRPYNRYVLDSLVPQDGRDEADGFEASPRGEHEETIFPRTTRHIDWDESFDVEAGMPLRWLPRGGRAIRGEVGSDG